MNNDFATAATTEPNCHKTATICEYLAEMRKLKKEIAEQKRLDSFDTVIIRDSDGKPCMIPKHEFMRWQKHKQEPSILYSFNGWWAVQLIKHSLCDPEVFLFNSAAFDLPKI